LVSAHPTGDSDEEELELRRHRVENLSEVPSAQSSQETNRNIFINSVLG
jgi:hypothetical protein